MNARLEFTERKARMKQATQPTEGRNLARGKKEPTPGEIIAQRIIEERMKRVLEANAPALLAVYGCGMLALL